MQAMDVRIIVAARKSLRSDAWRKKHVLFGFRKRRLPEKKQRRLRLLQSKKRNNAPWKATNLTRSGYDILENEIVFASSSAR